MLNAGRLYHYTNYNALEFILPSQKTLAEKGIFNKNTEFRFTRYDCLNDSDEGQILIDFLEKQRERVCRKLDKVMGTDFSTEKYDRAIDSIKEKWALYEKEYNKCFTFCASKLRDASVFWLSPYANEERGGGICLSFDSYYIDKELEDFKGECFLKKESLTQSFVEYVDPFAPKRGFIMSERFLDYLVSLLNGDVIAPDRYVIKYAGWKAEEEFRWIYRPSEQSIQYDSDEKKTPRARLYFNNVIDEVILGPSFKEDDIKRVKDELNERGHERIKVSLSKVKLRK